MLLKHLSPFCEIHEFGAILYKKKVFWKQGKKSKCFSKCHNVPSVYWKNFLVKMLLYTIIHLKSLLDRNYVILKVKSKQTSPHNI